MDERAAQGHMTAEMGAYSGPVPELGVAQFRIQLAGLHAAVVLDRALVEDSRAFDPGPVEHRFDLGGEA